MGLKHVLRRQPRPQFLKWYKTFRWLFGSHNNPLTRQSIITVIGVQLKSAAKLSTVIGLITKHADCRIYCIESVESDTEDWSKAAGLKTQELNTENEKENQQKATTQSDATLNITIYTEQLFPCTTLHHI